MKITKLLFFIILIFSFSFVSAQEAEDQEITDQTNDTTQIWKITLSDGNVLVGNILWQTEREVKIKLSDRTIIIPQYQIKKFEKINSGKDNTTLKSLENEDLFGNRYAFVPSALPLRKNEGQFTFSLVGIDYQHGITDNLSVGIVSTWISVPVVVNAKYTLRTPNPKINFAVGTYIGSGSWVSSESVGALPFGSLTLGDRDRNLSLTAGYMYTNLESDEYSGLVVSGGGLVKVSSKIALSIEGFYFTEKDQSLLGTDMQGMISPAIRWQFGNEGSFQFGFTGFLFDDEIIPLPSLRFMYKL